MAIAVVLLAAAGLFIKSLWKLMEVSSGFRTEHILTARLSGVDNSWAFSIEGRTPNPPGVFDITNYRPVTAGYVETMGIPVLRGLSHLRRPEMVRWC